MAYKYAMAAISAVSSSSSQPKSRLVSARHPTAIRFVGEVCRHSVDMTTALVLRRSEVIKFSP
jgi:hypothetical protein